MLDSTVCLTRLHQSPNRAEMLRYNCVMKTISGVTAAIVLAVGIAACEKKVEPEPAKPRWQYTEEDFGMGKPHTKNRACNREIDKILDQIRVCYNTRTDDECSRLQTQLSDRIGRLKNTRRCSR
jgi:hypothetical protein